MLARNAAELKGAELKGTGVIVFGTALADARAHAAWHAQHATSGMGRVYQGRYKPFPDESDEHKGAVLRYAARKIRCARLMKPAEQWRWRSLWKRTSDNAEARAVLSDPQIKVPRNQTACVKRAETKIELAALHTSVKRGQPFGDEAWQQ